MAFARSAPILAALLCIACGSDHGDRAGSLVGAGAIPPSQELAGESIMIIHFTMIGVPGGETLRRELRPDDRLAVTLVQHPSDPRDYAENGAERILAEETHRLSAEAAARARHALRRMRPEKLAGLDREVRPLGCERRSSHDFGEAQIVFHDGDAAGLFVLPSQQSCDTPAAREARRLVRQTLGTFPRSSAVAAFEEFEPRRQAR